MVKRQGPVTLEGLRARRAEIERIAEERGVRDIRVFGSVARGEAGATSDVDLLVKLTAGRGVLDVSELILDLEELLGCPVDVIAVRDGSQSASVLFEESIPL